MYSKKGTYKVLTIKNVQDGYVNCNSSNCVCNIPDKMKDWCQLSKGDVVLSLTGNVGRVGIVAEKNCLLNQRVAVVLPNDSNQLPAFYFWFRNLSFQNKMVGISKGTAQSNLSPIETLKLKIPYCPNKFKKFNGDIVSIYESILALKVESGKLAHLRDSLLPKLMSGEIDVSDIKCGN